MKPSFLQRDLRPVLWYFIGAGVWIIATDVMQTAIRTHFSVELAAQLELVKGLFFVTATTYLLWKYIVSTRTLLPSQTVDTEELQIQQALVLQTNLWNDIPIVLLTTEGVIKQHNPLMEEMFSLPKNNKQNGNFLVYIVPQYRDNFVECLSKAQYGMVWHGEVECTTATEQGNFWIDIISLPIEQDDGSIVVWCFIQDISSRKQREFSTLRKYQETERAFRSQSLELSQLKTEKDEMLSIAAHDLRNPLSAITIAASTLKMEAIKEQNNKRLERIAVIERSINRMNGIISMLLELRSLQEGIVLVDTRQYNIVALLQAIIEECTVTAKIKHISLIFETQVPQITAVTDERLFRGIIENILSNAIKFSPPEAKVIVSATVDTENSPTMMCIRISDNGPGIQPHELALLFKPFAKLSNKPTGGEQSTGLGLVIARKMAEVLHGSIDCESEVGKGTTFSINLPIHC